LAFVALSSGLVFMYLRNRKIYREYSVLKEQNEAELELDRIGPPLHARTHTHARTHARGTRTHTRATHACTHSQGVCVL
jgi:diphthamide biosynthesis methyltransferase